MKVLSFSLFIISLIIFVNAQTQDDIFAMNSCIAGCPTVNPEAEACYVACIDAHYIQKQNPTTPQVTGTINSPVSSPTQTLNNQNTMSNTQTPNTSTMQGSVTTATDFASTTTKTLATGLIQGNNTMMNDDATTTKRPSLATNGSVISMEDSSSSKTTYSIISMIIAIVLAFL